MAFSAIRGFSKITRYLPAARSILSSQNGGLFRIGGNTCNARTLTRSMFVLCRNRDNDPLDVLGKYSVTHPSSSKCGCGKCDVHTQGKEVGDKELVAFLEEEIANETKSQPKSSIVPEIDEFLCKYDGSEVTLTRKFNNEDITISTNVNHSVDADDTEPDPTSPREEGNVEMSSKPDFTIEIAKKNRILCFQCSFVRFLPEETGEQNYNDAFQITELSLYEDEEKDSTYVVAGDIMDGYLYDLLMNYLDERGISNSFVEKLGSVLTSYEHNLYVGLLKGMKNFLEK